MFECNNLLSIFPEMIFILFILLYIFLNDFQRFGIQCIAILSGNLFQFFPPGNIYSRIIHANPEAASGLVNCFLKFIFPSWTYQHLLSIYNSTLYYLFFHPPCPPYDRFVIFSAQITMNIITLFLSDCKAEVFTQSTSPTASFERMPIYIMVDILSYPLLLFLELPYTVHLLQLHWMGCPL